MSPSQKATRPPGPPRGLVFGPAGVRRTASTERGTVAAIPTARRGERGFTLLEILVVTAILAMLLGLGVGGYMALARGADIEGTASRVRSVLIHARNTT
ncbi:MAG: pilus assembly FimT family protein, partial [Planctomycetota bacterium]